MKTGNSGPLSTQCAAMMTSPARISGQELMKSWVQYSIIGTGGLPARKRA